MKADTQHLDFLISQYVDGCLDGASRKSVEQQMLTDPDARKLYAEHREVQDLLDDWGNRIPLIDWEGFDRKLAGKLEKEAVVGERRMMIRKWMKPMAAAAALFVAATLGYGWHAISSGGQQGIPGNGAVAYVAQPKTTVSIDDQPKSTQPFRSGMKVEESEAIAVGDGRLDMGAVAVAPPGDAEAADALKEAVGYGLEGVKEIVRPEGAGSNHYVLGGAPSDPKGEDKGAQPGFPYP